MGDLNHDGKIDRGEFIAAAYRKKRYRRKKYRKKNRRTRRCNDGKPQYQQCSVYFDSGLCQEARGLALADFDDHNKKKQLYARDAKNNCRKTCGICGRFSRTLKRQDRERRKHQRRKRRRSRRKRRRSRRKRRRLRRSRRG